MDPEDDPLETQPAAERTRFFAGQLLTPDLLRGEQTYHRSRLATALRHLVGAGTVAGLRVTQPEPGRIEVAPGLAIDALGRLVELRTPASLDVSGWLARQDPFAYEAALEVEPPAILADVTIRATAAPFPEGDTSTALVETALIAVAATWDPDPVRLWPAADAPDTEKLAAVLDAWPSDDPPEDATAPGLLLARLTFPLDTTLPILVDNAVRPFIFLPGKWPPPARTG